MDNVYQHPVNHYSNIRVYKALNKWMVTTKAIGGNHVVTSTSYGFKVGQVVTLDQINSLGYNKVN